MCLNGSDLFTKAKQQKKNNLNDDVECDERIEWMRQSFPNDMMRPSEMHNAERLHTSLD